MTDLKKQELRRLAEAAQFGGGAHEDIEFSNLLDLHQAVTPAAILALLDECERLHTENDEIKYLSLDDQRRRMEAEKECEQLRGEVEALRKDAERWRLVRSPVGTESSLAVWHEGRMPVFSAIADRMVDEAIANESARQGEQP